MTEPDTVLQWLMKNDARNPDPLPLRATRILKRLKSVRGLDDGEKSLHALGLAASPDERWTLWERQIRSNGYWKPSNPIVPKSGDRGS